MIDLNSFYYDRITIGSCLVSPENHDYVYIDIPKNASSSIKHAFADTWEWKNFIADESILSKSTEIIVILRDPLTRWISGITQYFESNLKIDLDLSNDALVKIVFNTVQFEIHTTSQTNFLFNMNKYVPKCVFFMCDTNLTSNLNDYFRNRIDRNVSIQHLHRPPPNNEFIEFVKNNKQHQQQIKDYFQRDYDFINSVQFYKA